MSLPQDDDPALNPDDLCTCEFMPFDDGGTMESYHYKRRCYLCGKIFWSTHCIHEPKRSCGCDNNLY